MIQDVSSGDGRELVMGTVKFIMFTLERQIFKPIIRSLTFPEKDNQELLAVVNTEALPCEEEGKEREGELRQASIKIGLHATADSPSAGMWTGGVF